VNPRDDFRVIGPDVDLLGQKLEMLPSISSARNLSRSLTSWTSSVLPSPTVRFFLITFTKDTTIGGKSFGDETLEYWYRAIRTFRIVIALWEFGRAASGQGIEHVLADAEGVDAWIPQAIRTASLLETDAKCQDRAAEIERKRRRNVEEATHGIRRNRSAAVLFGAAAKEWLAVKQAGWAPKTHIIAATDVEHLKNQFAKLLLTDITDRDIAKYQKHRRDAKAASKTINNEVATLRAILRRHGLWATVAPCVRLLGIREQIVHRLFTTELWSSA
jgi:hypothetical protein